MEDAIARKRAAGFSRKAHRARLGGLSAYFIALSREVQDSIIERTPHIV